MIDNSMNSAKRTPNNGVKNPKISKTFLFMYYVLCSCVCVCVKNGIIFIPQIWTTMVIDHYSIKKKTFSHFPISHQKHYMLLSILHRIRNSILYKHTHNNWLLLISLSPSTKFYVCINILSMYCSGWPNGWLSKYIWNYIIYIYICK